jgi:2-oxoisovalerate dehydrogenase E1 component
MNADARSICRALLLPRMVEEKMLRLIRQGRISKWFSGYGQEAIAVGCALALDPRDYILPMHRNLGVWTTRGVALRPLLCQATGRRGGFTRGRDRSFHFGLLEKRIVGMISQLGAMLPVACGLGLAARLKGEPFVALSMIGEGATRQGDFHEALNLAALWKLPVVFVVENNGYGLSTPASEAIPVQDVADAASGYGMPGQVVDGNDVEAVIKAVRGAADRARVGEGPTLLEMKTFRMRGHEEASGTKYVPPHLFEAWTKNDPVDGFIRRAVEAGHLSDADVAAIRSELAAVVEDAAEFALGQPEETSTVAAERSDVYATPRIPPLDPSGPQTERRFVDAIGDGLRQAMERDERVLMLGQDIAEYGGVFKVTHGLVEQFGRERVRNTPIIESGAIGAAMGLALEGFKPVVEMQYADFIACGFNQIVNNLATTHYRWGAPLPVTIRAPFGGQIGAGPFHSQSMEAWFCHVPGLKVVVPATPEDAKGLLLAAIDDPNPVLYFEHKFLYRALKGLVPEAPFHVALGRACVAREGRDVTLVTYGIGVFWALEEAEFQEQRGASIEVIDLRTLIPWDRGTVLASVAKTNRLLVLHEAVRTGGFGGELVSEICEAAFADLDAPPVRLGGEDFPIPFSRGLEQELHAARSRLRQALERLLAY